MKKRIVKISTSKNQWICKKFLIPALDPAKPLIRNSVKLRPGMAEAVQVIHTNAGVYGESGKLGKVDFCLNGGKVQPVCENATSNSPFLIWKL